MSRPRLPTTSQALRTNPALHPSTSVKVQLEFDTVTPCSKHDAESEMSEDGRNTNSQTVEFGYLKSQCVLSHSTAADQSLRFYTAKAPPSRMHFSASSTRPRSFLPAAAHFPSSRSRVKVARTKQRGSRRLRRTTVLLPNSAASLPLPTTPKTSSVSRRIALTHRSSLMSAHSSPNSCFQPLPRSFGAASWIHRHLLVFLLLLEEERHSCRHAAENSTGRHRRCRTCEGIRLPNLGHGHSDVS